ncbi:MAG: hypothetical protein AAF399_02535 [Bacteroidota bacterium]
MRRGLLSIRLIGAAMILSGIVACQFDADEAYYPFTQAAYLLYQGEENSETHLIQVKGTQSTWAWEEQWSPGPLLAMTGNATQLWLSMGNEIIELDLSSESLVQRIPLDSLQGHFLAVGRQELLVVDSNRQEMGFLPLDGGSIVRRSLEGQPTLTPAYFAEVFYLPLDSQRVLLYHELAYAPLNEVALSAPIQGISPDYVQSIACLLQFPGDSTLSIQSLDANTRRLAGPPRRIPWQQIQFSPFQVVRFGKEFTSNARLLGTKSVPSVLESVESYAFDFFENHSYYHNSAGLSRYDFRNRVRDSLLPLPYSGRLTTSHFYRAPNEP